MVIITMILFMKSYLIECVHPKGVRCFYAKMKGNDYMEMSSRPVELRDTVALMESTDYKDRFKAEYYQLVIRFNKLQAMLEKWDKCKLGFIPTCPKAAYNFQIKAMGEYIASLEVRAKIEGIEL